MAESLRIEYRTNIVDTLREEVKFQQPRVCVICNEKNNTTLWLDILNKWKVNSEKKVLSLSINNKPMVSW